jgi:hypothetical protein
MTAALNLALLGATGNTGKLFLKQALAQEHHVTAFVRDIQKANLSENPRLTVVAVDVFDHASMAPHFIGKDAVVSALGFPKAIPGAAIQTVTDFTRSMSPIIQAMHDAEDVTRLVTISAWFTNKSTRAGQRLYEQMWSKLPGLVGVLDNEGEMEELLIKQLGEDKPINFTSVRAPTLTWDDSSELEILTSYENNWVEGASDFMPRADVAKFMLGCVLDQETYGKCVSIGVKYTEEENKKAGQRLRARFAASH